MCTLPLFAPLRRMVESTPFLPPFFPSPEICSSWGTSIAITPFGTQEVLPAPAGRKYSTESSLLTFSPSMTLTYLPFSTAPLVVAPPVTFAFSSLALSCSWEVLQDLVSDHLLILLSVLLSPVFRPNERPLYSILRKLGGMTSTLTVLLQRNTRLFLFPLLLLFFPLWH